MDLKKQILVALGLDKQDEVALEYQAKLEDGTLIVSTSTNLEAGVDISVLTEDGSTMLLPVGEYKTEDGQRFSVEKDGVVAELYSDEVEKETEGEPVNEEMGNEKDEDEYEDDGKEADVEDWAGMEKRIKNLEDAISDMKSKMDYKKDEDYMEEEEVEMEVSRQPKSRTVKEEFNEVEEKVKEELSQPSANPIKHNPESSNKKSTNGFLYSQKRVGTALDRVLARLNK